MTVNEHLIATLAEEGNEVGKDCMKMLRYPGDRGDKKAHIVDELNDFKAMVEMLVEKGVVPAGWEHEGKKFKKKMKVCRLMRSHGRVSDPENIPEQY